MTKEELEKEAGDYADEHAFRVPYDGSNKFYDDVDFKASKEGYLAGAKPREKRIEELENKNIELLGKIAFTENALNNAKAQIEKMKELLEDWYNQHSDNTYTKTFYDTLIKATEKFLWSDVCVK